MTLTGSQALNGGPWLVTGGGTGSWGIADPDSFHYVWQSFSGDSAVSAFVTPISSRDGSKEGMILIHHEIAANSA